MTFRISPYIGVNGIVFGATPVEVSSKLGVPGRVRTTRLGELEETRGDAFYRYSSGKLVEVSFGKKSAVSFADVDLLRDPASLETLLLHDPEPLELHGFLVFLRLGIAITGIHDNNMSQLAVTAFVKGRWDDLRQTMNRWNP